MPVVTIQMFEGRTIEQKKKVVEGITAVMVGIGCQPEAVHVVIYDIPRHNWADAGKLASEK